MSANDGDLVDRMAKKRRSRPDPGGCPPPRRLAKSSAKPIPSRRHNRTDNRIESSSPSSVCVAAAQDFDDCLEHD